MEWHALGSGALVKLGSSQGMRITSQGNEVIRIHRLGNTREDWGGLRWSGEHGEKYQRQYRKSASGERARKYHAASWN
jgi:hypothetical protein